jgi:hypothetical protein
VANFVGGFNRDTLTTKKVGTFWLMQYSFKDRSLTYESTRRLSQSGIRRVAGESRTVAPQEQQGVAQATLSLNLPYKVCKQNRAMNKGLQRTIAGSPAGGGAQAGK